MLQQQTTIAVVSGKGGVGKSVLAVNLAETLAMRGRRVGLLDADLDQGACAILLDTADRPEVRETASGVLTAPDPTQPPTIQELERALTHDLMDRDTVLIDSPAGTGPLVQWALSRADFGLLVLVDEPTAIADAYRLARRVWESEPGYPLAAVVNLADHEAEASDVAGRFAHLTRHFLGQETMYLGWVPFSASVRRSVRKQRPAVQESPIIFAAFERLVQAIEFGRLEPISPLVLN